MSTPCSTNVKRAAFAAFLLLSSAAQAVDDAHLDWWRESRFGLFVHFGLYALPARHEWVKSKERIDDAAYDRYLKYFNPDLFDAREWARKAKAAGMKYAVITSKHHEGFCLFDSAFTDYKSTNTPFGRDIIKEFVEAFRAEGLKVGFYYSLPDWHHPDFTVDRYHPRRPVDCSPWDKKGMEGPEEPWDRLNEGKDMARYRKYLFSQVEELLTKYDKIDLMWFDFTMPGPRTKHSEDWNARELLALVRRLQPGIIVNDRLGLKDGDFGDFVTPEQQVQKKWVERDGKRVPWEMCQTFSGSWGYHRDEKTWKSPKDVVRILVQCVSHGGNLILNVGPTGRGEFDYRACERLDAVGEWMKRNSRSIYSCTEAPGKFKAPEGTILTYNPALNRLYLHLDKYPVSPLAIDFADEVEYAQFLHDASEIRIADGALVLPKAPPRSEMPVVELFIKGDAS